MDISAEDDILGEAGGVAGAISTQAVLNFVDLAGSERASVHENSGNPQSNALKTSGSRTSSPFGPNNRASAGTNQRMKEGQHINKSLFFLT